MSDTIGARNLIGEQMTPKDIRCPKCGGQHCIDDDCAVDGNVKCRDCGTVFED